MQKKQSLEKCMCFVEYQLRESDRFNSNKLAPFVTISRQTGSGGHSIGNELSLRLSKSNNILEGAWALFDRNLVVRVLDDHKLPRRLASFMPENSVNEINSTIEEILGLHPSHWTLIGNTAETIYSLAKLGHVILIGRGSHIITRMLPHGVHIRLIASEEFRAQNLMKSHNFGHAKAMEYIRYEDKFRYNYLKKYYNRDINDPSQYDMVINTDHISPNTAAKIIEELLLERLH